MMRWSWNTNPDGSQTCTLMFTASALNSISFQDQVFSNMTEVMLAVTRLVASDDLGIPFQDLRIAITWEKREIPLGYFSPLTPEPVVEAPKRRRLIAAGAI